MLPINRLMVPTILDYPRPNTGIYYILVEQFYLSALLHFSKQVHRLNVQIAIEQQRLIFYTAAYQYFIINRPLVTNVQSLLYYEHIRMSASEELFISLSSSIFHLSMQRMSPLLPVVYHITFIISSTLILMFYGLHRLYSLNRFSILFYLRILTSHKLKQ